MPPADWLTGRLMRLYFAHRPNLHELLIERGGPDAETAARAWSAWDLIAAWSSGVSPAKVGDIAQPDVSGPDKQHMPYLFSQAIAVNHLV